MKVSFVLPSKDSACWLAHSLESVQKQTYANIEIIVVNDGSKDSTRELLDFVSAKDKRIKPIHFLAPGGRSFARNAGNEAATGDIICVLDADDLAEPERARLTVEKFKRNVDVVYGSMQRMDAIGNKRGELLADVFNRERCFKDKTFYIVHSSVAYRKEVALRFPYKGGEVADLGIDDFTFYAEAAAAGLKFDFIPNLVGTYRVLSTGISRVRDEKKVLEVKEKILAALNVAA